MFSIALTIKAILIHKLTFSYKCYSKIERKYVNPLWKSTYISSKIMPWKFFYSRMHFLKWQISYLPHEVSFLTKENSKSRIHFFKKIKYHWPHKNYFKWPTKDTMIWLNSTLAMIRLRLPSKLCLSQYDELWGSQIVLYLRFFPVW